MTRGFWIAWSAFWLGCSTYGALLAWSPLYGVSIALNVVALLVWWRVA